MFFLIVSLKLNINGNKNLRLIFFIYMMTVIRYYIQLLFLATRKWYVLVYLNF